jgi:hypothetical protein
LAATARQQYDYAALYEDDSYSTDYGVVSSQQQVESASKTAGTKAAQPAAEFKDAALLQQLDDALLQLEKEQQQQQQGEKGHKASGLALPGMKHASLQQAV